MEKDSRGCCEVSYTRCVHAGEPHESSGSPFSPLYDTSTFTFPNSQAMLDVVTGKAEGPLYTRYGMNPGILALEEKLRSVESAGAALSFCSGMAAISATVMAFGRNGVVCVGDIYGGTHELLESQLPEVGIKTRFVLSNELDTLDDALSEGASILFIETPSNPKLEVFDISAMSAMAKKHGAKLVVDNTFATPVNQTPLTIGADIVVHSATKYMGGHSDLTAGAAMGSIADMKILWNWRKNLGQCISPEVAHKLLRSLRTLRVRVEAHNRNAQKLAEWLEQHPMVSRVHYPGLKSHPNHAVAARQSNGGFGGMLSFEVNGTSEDTVGVVDACELFAIAPSLGGVESLILQPAACTHYAMGADERARRCIRDQLVRCSIGLEDVEDLIADLDQALAQIDGVATDCDSESGAA